VEPLLVITNVDAGSADQERLDQALEVLRSECSVEVAATANPGELDGVLHRAASRRIVVAGGDGSLHAVVRALHRRRELNGRVLALLPLGTGNDFARGVGLPLEPEAAAEIVLAGAPRPVDLLVDEVGEIVVNNVHAGAGAVASRHGARAKSVLEKVGLGKVGLGRLSYPVGAAITAINPPTLRLRVKVDGEVVNDLDHPVLMVALGNGSSVGGGAELNPDADPESGLIDVVVSRAVGPLARLQYAVRLGRGEHHLAGDVVHVRGREVSISGEEFWCSADGEVYGPERQRTWHVEPAAYSLVLPLP
jgi:diacylglycerol kinase (ATP)